MSWHGKHIDQIYHRNILNISIIKYDFLASTEQTLALFTPIIHIHVHVPYTSEVWVVCSQNLWNVDIPKCNFLISIAKRTQCYLVWSGDMLPEILKYRCNKHDKMQCSGIGKDHPSSSKLDILKCKHNDLLASGESHLWDAVIVNVNQI